MVSPSDQEIPILYNATSLEEFNNYSFVISAVNVHGESVASDPITAQTIPAGKYHK